MRPTACYVAATRGPSCSHALSFCHCSSGHPRYWLPAWIFELKNATGYDIEAFYVDPSDSEEWSGNICKRAELPDGASASVTFDGDPQSCKWDIKVDWVGDYEPTVCLTSIFARFQRSL